jgi:peptidoglycan/xylan/chitin deacetylase (PgdA/CDA1 family)
VQFSSHLRIADECELPMKRLALALLQRCGAFDFARTMSSSMGRILMYHNFANSCDSNRDAVLVHDVRAQMSYLRRHFEIVPLATLVECIRSGARFRDRMVVLTVDDGRRNFYEYFYPLLKEFAVPATFFVVSSFIEGAGWIWTDKILWLAEQPCRPDELAPERLDHFFAELNALNPAVRNRQIGDLAAQMGVEIPLRPPAKYAPCSWSELREMADSGLVEIGSHTVNHPILSAITDSEALWQLTDSRAQIETNLSRKVDSFCFPNGKPSDYRPIHMQQLQDAGYKSAVVARFGLVSRTSNVFELPRIGISGRSDVLSFSKNVDGAGYFQSKLEASLGVRGESL